MYKAFHIRNFRGFDDLRLDDLARVNLIAGKNNVGKTALLEALFIHLGVINPEIAVRLLSFRGKQTVRLQVSQWTDAPWDSLFRQFNTQTPILFTGEGDKSVTRSLELRVIQDVNELKEVRSRVQTEANGSNSLSTTSESIRVLRLTSTSEGEISTAHAIIDHSGLSTETVSSPPFESIFLATRIRTPLAEEADRFTSLVVNGKKDVLQKALMILEPQLRGVELLTFAGETMLHGDIGGTARPIPLILMGDGMTRLASLIIAIGYARVVIVDEIENGIHHSILKDIWTAIGYAARQFNTQVFATTHSWECIVAAHRAFAESDTYDFRLHRLDRTASGDIQAVTYDQETLEAAIEIGMEVR